VSFAPRNCSGDMYASEPSSARLLVMRMASSRRLARPKSNKSACPSAVTATFEGLTSRCSTPRA
jgi:hypothetical protein